MTAPATGSFEPALQSLEAQLATISEVVLHGNPDEVQAAAVRLREAVDAWGRWLSQREDGSGSPDAALQLRLQTIAASMQSTREGLLRRATLSGLALQAILPPDSAITYSPTGGAAATRLRGRGGYAV